jgi:hypothetical protein
MEIKIMGRNSRINKIWVSEKKCQRPGKLQLYAPYTRREINCNVAIIQKSPC